MMHVAVGIIFNSANEILIAERPPEKYKGGFWEFPGGKVEGGETIFEALKRELNEELGIVVQEAEKWLQFSYDYIDRVVLLDTWIITKYEGQPKGIEGQSVKWIPPHQLDDYRFPEGNKIIIEKLKNKSAI